eukprot:764967-Hanusia_phi.AAC.7
MSDGKGSVPRWRHSARATEAVPGKRRELQGNPLVHALAVRMDATGSPPACTGHRRHEVEADEGEDWPSYPPACRYLGCCGDVRGAVYPQLPSHHPRSQRGRDHHQRLRLPPQPPQARQAAPAHHVGHVQVRRRVHVREPGERSRRAGCGRVKAVQIGCDGGRLYFDGCALICSNGQVVAQGAQFSMQEVTLRWGEMGGGDLLGPQVEVVTAAVDLSATRSMRGAFMSRCEQVEG